MQEKIIKNGYTFEDVLLIPEKSNVLPLETNIRSQLTQKISLNIPLLSAAMDTVTEASMAIAMAREGGVGIIHKNMSMEKQADEVRKVKRSESGMISNPYTLSPHHKIGDAIKLMHKYNISGIPITERKRLVGILTNRDLRFQKNLSKKISTIMTPRKKLVTAPKGTTLDEAKDILQKHRIEKLLVVNDKKELAGLITIKDILKKMQFPNACTDTKGRLITGAAVGTARDTMERVKALVNAGVDVITVDTAHGHSTRVLRVISEIKAKYPALSVVGGNVCTASATEDLIKAGVDAVKVGIGPGSICTTRVVAGIGVPQITAIYDCFQIARRYGIPLISDGGIRFSGDIAKAVAAGASCVMVGNLFAGTDESPGEIVLYEGRRFKTYRGMGSLEAMKLGSSDRYFQFEQDQENKLIPEGIVGRVPYKGPVLETIFQLLGGLKLAMGYCGKRTIQELMHTAKFITVTSASIQESHPHDVTITQEAPNYQKFR
jgi:IMP dehydrogenase